MAGMIMGTAGYMSPEQAKGKPVDRRADIWAFGVVFAEMLTGRAMYTGETVSEVLAAVIMKEPPIPESVPPYIRQLLRRCLDRDPSRRLRDIGEARIALENPGRGFARGPVRAHACRPPPPAGGWRLPRRWRWRWRLCPRSIFARRRRSRPRSVSRCRRPRAALSPYPSWRCRRMAGSSRSVPAARAAASLFCGSARSIPWKRAPCRARRVPSFLSGRRTAVSLAFSVNGKLKKIEASGGPPQTLCNVSNYTATAGYWNRDGVIFFGGGPEGIFRVPQAGGDPVRVTRPDTAHGETMHFYPHILPDGRHYLYLIQFAARENNAIYLGSLDGNQKKRLVGTSYGFSYAPPAENGKSGHLLFLREDTLMAQPLDSGTFELAGDAFPVAERVGISRAYALFTVSPGGALAYRSGGGVGTRQLNWFDRAGKPLATLGAPADYNNVALSRDGTRAAVMQVDSQTGNRDIWLIDTTRGIPARFTFDEAAEADPVWSPDGSRVAFSSTRDGPINIYVKDASGAAKEERLQKAEGDERPCDWSPDGRFLMFTRGSRGSSQLWFLSDPTGDPAKRKTAPYRETPFSTTQCQFSPGPPGAPQWVAYNSDESKHGSEIYVQSFPAGAGQYLVSSGGGTQPRWRRDGKAFLHRGRRQTLMAVDVKTAPRFEASIPHALFDSRMWNANAVGCLRYGVAPDGQRFLVNHREAGRSCRRARGHYRCAELDGGTEAMSNSRTPAAS